MSQVSAAPECAEAREAYDTCFKHWFKGYFNVTADPKYPYSRRTGAERCQKQADEYKDQCGDAWKAFRNCIEEVRERNNLTEYNLHYGTR